MGWHKTQDLAVVVGTYPDSNGDTKKRYEQVGHIWTSDDGDNMVTIKRTFNPAGVPNPDDRDSVALYMFEIRNKNQGQDQDQQQRRDGGNNNRQQRHQDDGGGRQERQQRRPPRSPDDVPF